MEQGRVSGLHRASLHMTPSAIALNRFGLGARPEDSFQDDPRRWLATQFARFEPRPAALADVPSRRVIAGQLADYFEQLRETGRLSKRPAMIEKSGPTHASPGMASQTTPSDAVSGLPEPVQLYIRGEARAAYLAAVAGRVNAALMTPAPFAERLVHFWANHFAVSIDKLPVIGLGGLLEFEAIRPNLLGTFYDMLVAVEQHPAMLLYLDQAQSIGPDSQVSQMLARRPNQKKRAGLNENLAREILELHTLGAHGGYTQADVTEFARALTGWTVNGISRAPGVRRLGLDGPAGDFAFVPFIHQPGTRTVMGRTYRAEGEGQARAILADVASHPATATHIATKLARHFAGDSPPAALTDRLARAFLQSGGDLPTLYRVLIEAPELWVEQPLKFKSPWDWSLSALRAVGSRQVPAQNAAGLLIQLGQPVWRPGSPAGWDDTDASWAGPDALTRRVEAADRIANRAGNAHDPRTLAAQILPGAVSPQTSQTIMFAESPAQGLALLLVSPEFMRR